MKSTARAIVFCVVLSVAGGLQAEIQNEQIGFSPNHIFDGVIKGENVDVMTGNVNIRIPLGPRYILNEWFGYQVELYYNSRIWKHQCPLTGPLNDCPGELMGTDTYGQGWRISFGQIYRDAPPPGAPPEVGDYLGVFHYQTPSGGDRMFCIAQVQGSVCADYELDGYSFDSSATRFEWIPVEGSGVKFKIYPGDGTALETTASANGPWHVNRIETLDRKASPYEEHPQHHVNISYVGTSGEIDKVEDSAGRTIEFTGGVIDFPALGGSVAATARYVLAREQVDIDDPVATDDPAYESQEGLNRWQLTSISLPGIAEQYLFPEYDRFGSLLRWRVPTGAEIQYAYTMYQTSEHRPYHVNMYYRGLSPDPDNNPDEVYEWTYTRFGAGVIHGIDDPVASQFLQRAASRGSNPSSVRVLDPFGNLTAYRFRWTPFDDDDCGLNCPTYWDDGMLWRVETYAGDQEDPTKLVRQETYFNMLDVGVDGNGNPEDLYFKYRLHASNDQQFKVNRVAINVRPYESEVFIPGGPDHPPSTYRTVSSDWDHHEAGLPQFGEHPLARLTQQFDGNVLYRQTRTEYDGAADYGPNVKLTEVLGAQGDVVSRTQQNHLGNRVLCAVRRASVAGTAEDLDPMCEINDALLDLEDGDTATIHSYNANGGSLEAKRVRGYASSDVHESSYAYVNGVLESAHYEELATSWLAVDRDLDTPSGKVLTSRSPDGIPTDYEWDLLGRLTEIEPESPEVATVIEYPSLLETRVVQTPDTGAVESVYMYDTLGRLICEARRNVEGTFDFQKTEYDISGRVTRTSVWLTASTASAACATDNGTITDWTTREYRVFETTDPVTGQTTGFVDPLGRVSKVTYPDDSIVKTAYQGLATTVTVDDIAGGEDNGSGGVNRAYLTAATVYVNDPFGRLVAVDSPDEGADAAYTYDERDNLTEVRLASTSENQLRRFGYDTLGRLVYASHPESGTVEYLDYDARGKLLEYRDARGGTFVQEWDPAARLVKRSLETSDGVSTSLEPLVENFYDSGVDSGSAEGKLTKQLSYKIVNDVAVLVATRQYGYGDYAAGCPQALSGISAHKGLNGRLQWTKMRIAPWAKDVVTDYCYDTLGSPYSVAYPDFTSSGRTRSTVSYAPQHGRLWGVQDLGRDVEYIAKVGYDANGAVSGFTRGNGMRTAIERDRRGRPENFRVEEPTGAAPVAREDLNTLFGCSGQGPFGHCDDRWSGGTALTWQTGTYVYDGAGNIESIGQGEAQAEVQSRYYYDQLNRLTAAHLTPPAPSDSIWLYHDYDAYGNMVEHTKIVGSTTDTFSYAVQPSTNRLQELTVNGIDSPVLYDANGNLVYDGNLDYLFDAENRLQGVWDNGGEALGEYDYDQNGYRVRAIGGGVETFYFRDDEGKVLSEFQRELGNTGDPTWNRDYIYALGQTINVVKNDEPSPVGQLRITSVDAFQLVSLEWDAVPDLDVAKYVLTRTAKNPTDATVTYDVIPAGSAPTISFLDNIGGSAGTRFTYTVRAVDDAANAGPESQAVILRPFDGIAPVYPSEFQVRVRGYDDRVVVTWDEVQTDDFSGYILERMQVINPATDVWVMITGMLYGTTYVDHDVDNGATYRYRVIAVDTAGHFAVPTAVSPNVTPQDSDPPAKPVGVVGMPRLEAGSALVHWLPVLDGDVAVYRVYRSTVAGQLGTYIEVSWIQNKTSQLGLSHGATYYYTVIAVDTSGNESLPSAQIAIRTRKSSITKPTTTGATAFVEDVLGNNGTFPYPNNSCALTMRDDDLIGIQVTWTPSAHPSIVGYRVYRTDRSGVPPLPNPTKGLLFSVIADVSTSVDSYLDTALNHFDYAYYVVGYNSQGLESDAILKFGSGQWDPQTTVENLVAIDGRDEYATENGPSRRVTLQWSRTVAPELQGYHVYRRCEWLWCEGPALFNPSTDHFACVPSWTRLTQQPIVSPRTFADTTVGGLNGCFQYTVRPVGPDHAEGEVQKVLAVSPYDYVPFEPEWDPEQICDGRECYCAEDISTELPFPEYFLADGQGQPILDSQGNRQPIGTDEIARVNAIARGGMSANGPPAPPSEVHVSQPVHEDPTYRGLRRTRYFAVEWSPNSEVDLAGYHVERAGSHAGPWQRLTVRPVAWWETRYDLRGVAVPQPNGSWIGLVGLPGDATEPGCNYFRVIAVDETGLESPPGEPTYNPADSCPTTPTLMPPTDIVASSVGSGESCSNKLEWPIVQGGVAYNVYRYRFTTESFYFYRTQQVQATSCSGGGCEYTELGDANSPNNDPNVDCPWSSNYGLLGICNDGALLEAYYLTTVDSAGRESPRSEVVFWNCFDHSPFEPPAGYVLRMPESAPVTPVDVDCVDGGAFAVARVDVPPVAARNLFEGQWSALPGAAVDTPLTAPLITLGTNDPPYVILDLHTDHLGSVRLSTDDSGERVTTHDFLPFGEEIAPLADPWNRKMFTGHERDTETGLDYMLARYYGPNLGRFLSVDPAAESARLTSPQSWNRFAYVRNNPIGRIDPDGRSDAQAIEVVKALSVPAVQQALGSALQKSGGLTEVDPAKTREASVAIGKTGDGSFVAAAWVDAGATPDSTFDATASEVESKTGGDPVATGHTHQLVNRISTGFDDAGSPKPSRPADTEAARDMPLLTVSDGQVWMAWESDDVNKKGEKVVKSAQVISGSGQALKDGTAKVKTPKALK